LNERGNTANSNGSSAEKYFKNLKKIFNHILQVAFAAEPANGMSIIGLDDVTMVAGHCCKNLKKFCLLIIRI
jgi:hypothetical protein